MYSSYVFNKFWTFFQVHIVHIVIVLLCDCSLLWTLYDWG